MSVRGPRDKKESAEGRYTESAEWGMQRLMSAEGRYTKSVEWRMQRLMTAELEELDDEVTHLHGQLRHFDCQGGHQTLPSGSPPNAGGCMNKQLATSIKMARSTAPPSRCKRYEAFVGRQWELLHGVWGLLGPQPGTTGSIDRFDVAVGSGHEQ